MIPILTWLGLAALIVGGIVRLLKTDAMNSALAMLSLPPVPAWMLPWAALVFGAASGVIAALVKGTAWPDAIAQGLGAGATAVLGHEIVIEGMRGGKELGAGTAPKMPPFAGGLLFVLCILFASMVLTLTGCAWLQTPAGRAVVDDVVMTVDQIGCITAEAELGVDDPAIVVAFCKLPPSVVQQVTNLIVGHKKGMKLAAERQAQHDAGIDASNTLGYRGAQP